MVSLVEIQAQQNVWSDFQLSDIVEQLGLDFDDLTYLHELSPYLILDGHRTGSAKDDVSGYMEGAIFSLRFARIFKKLGGNRATFLIHTLRNYQVSERMKAIFSAIEEIGGTFIKTALANDIRLRYFGKNVHTSYYLADLINIAESATLECESFDLNFLTNYSEEWAIENLKCLDELPEISVVARFTKGHYSGAGIPSHMPKANFVYIQQASISENWSDEDIIILILCLLKSHLALRGFVGGKTYEAAERQKIRRRREIELYSEDIYMGDAPSKRLISFSPTGPITVLF